MGNSKNDYCGFLWIKEINYPIDSNSKPVVIASLQLGTVGREGVAGQF
jgi:hypothetical protein